MSTAEPLQQPVIQGMLLPDEFLHPDALGADLHHMGQHHLWGTEDNSIGESVILSMLGQVGTGGWQQWWRLTTPILHMFHRKISTM